MLRRLATIIFLGYALFPSTAHAYVDPGLVSMVIQGLFATVAGVAATYVLGPWQWLKSFFSKPQKPPQPEAKSHTVSDK